MGKKKVITEAHIRTMRKPQPGEIFGIATKLLGYDRVQVTCTDGHIRLGRIRGKMKRRVWIRRGDVVLIAPWDFQSDIRGDIVWRYTASQADVLRREGFLKI
jgi:translation initiation factor 1A